MCIYFHKLLHQSSTIPSKWMCLYKNMMSGWVAQLFFEQVVKMSNVSKIKFFLIKFICDTFQFWQNILTFYLALPESDFAVHFFPNFPKC